MFRLPCTLRSLNRREALSFETLEKKELLAGDVKVDFDVATRNLTITGDGAANQISIVQEFNNGSIVVQGEKGTETTVNGASFIELKGPFLNNLSVNLLEGNDSLRIVRTVFNYAQIDEAAKDAGNDHVIMRNVRAKGSVFIDTHAGNDTVRASGFFAGNVHVNTGDDADRVTMGGRIGVVLNENGRLDPEYTFDGATGGDRALVVDSGAGNDVIALLDLDVDGRIVVRSGDHDDSITFRNVRASERIDVFAGTGDDEVRISEVYSPVMDIRLEEGNDTFIQDFPGTLPKSRRVNGGSGFDQAILNGGPADVIVGFESVKA